MGPSDTMPWTWECSPRQHHRRGVHEHRVHAAEGVVRQTEQQHGGVGRDGDADLVGQLEAVRGLPAQVDEQAEGEVLETVTLLVGELVPGPHAGGEQVRARAGRTLPRAVHGVRGGGGSRSCTAGAYR